MEKSKRVKTKIDFQKVIASKKKIISKNFILYSLKREEYDYPRFGFSSFPISVIMLLGGTNLRMTHLLKDHSCWNLIV